MIQSSSAKAPPRPFLAAAPETRALIARLADLAAQPEAFPFETQAPPDWARIGFAARSEAERRALIEASVRFLEMRPDLEAFHQHGVCFRRRAVDPGGIAALFSGEQEAHPGMGAALTAGFPRASGVARSFDRMFAALGDPPLTEVVQGDDPRTAARLRSPIYAQLGAAALAAGQYAVLRAGGFAPDMLAGYGSGETTALWAAGAMEDETLGALLYARASAMSAPDPRRPSANLRVHAPIEDSLDLIGESGLRVFVARHEAPRSHVVGGEIEELEAFSARLLGRGIAHESMPGALAYHSARAEVAAATFAGALRRARLGEPGLPVYGAETALPYGPGEIVERLSRQLLRPLRFQETVERMHADGARIFVEFGPGDALTRHVRAILEGRPHMAVALDSAEPELSARRIMEAAAALAASGAAFKGERPPQPRPAPAPAPPRPEPKPEPEARPEAPRAEAPAPETTTPETAPPETAPPEAPMLEESFVEAPPPRVALLQAVMIEEALAEAPQEARLEPAEIEEEPPLAEPPQAPETAEAEAPEAEEQAEEESALPEPAPKLEEEAPAEEPEALSAVLPAAPEAEEPEEAAAAPAPEDPALSAALEEAPAQIEAEAEAGEEAEASAPEPVEAPVEPEEEEAPSAAPEEAPEEAQAPAAPPAPPAPLTGAALALRLAEQVTTAHARFLENQTAALRALLEASADPEALFAVEEARREAADSHRLYLEGIAALGGVRTGLASVQTTSAPALAALAALEADWPPALEPAEEEPYSDPPERFAAKSQPAPSPEPEPEIQPEPAPLSEAPSALRFEDAAPELLQIEAEREAEAEAQAFEIRPEPELAPEAAPEFAEEEAPALAVEALQTAEPEPAAPLLAPVEPEAAASEPAPEAAPEPPTGNLPATTSTNLPERLPENPSDNLPALRAPQELAVIPGPEAPETAEALQIEEAGFEPALTRLAFHLAPIAAPPLRQAHPGDARWLIVGDADLAADLAQGLRREAGEASCAAVAAAADVGALELFRDSGPWTGVVYLHPPGEDERTSLARLEIARVLAEAAQEAFHEAAARGERRVFATVARLDGALGYGPRAVEGLGSSAFGLAKALAAAEPNFFCRAVDLAADLPRAEAAALLVAELCDADRGRVEVAVSAAGRFESLPFLEPDPPARDLEEDEIFVLIGDARGVATLWLEEAAARAPRRCLLLGTHRLLFDEPAWAIGIKSEESLRWAAFQALEAEGADEDRAAVGAVALSEAVVADRETRACLSELRRLGSEAAYATVDFDAPDAADQIAAHLEEAGDGPVSVFYAPTSGPDADFSAAYRRRMRRVETLMDAFSGADLRRIWFLPTALDSSESLSDAMADEAVRRFAMGARAMGIDVRALLWALADEVEPGVVAALAEELRRPASGLGLTLIGGAGTALSLRRIDPGALTAGGAALKADWSALFGSAAMTPGAAAEDAALSASFALAAAFAAVERFAPGWRAQGCAGLSLANGAALGGAAGTGWTTLGLRSAEWTLDGDLKADLELFDDSGSARLKIEGARFSARAPAAESRPPVAPPEGSALGFYAEGVLTHGPELRLLEAFHMEEGAEEGLFALRDEAGIPGAERAALLDPLLAEGMVQSALAATRRRAGQTGALMRLENLFVREGSHAEGPLLVEARLRRDSTRAAVWRLTVRTPAGAALMACDAAVILGPPPAIRLAPQDARAEAKAEAAAQQSA
ncbi:acyltransferase domain-containing protein [Neomegalonema sp.]|uniref:acyltransferase domain-containing protein n=1 Tax=Neomegalonema sp. TaxID=2039713 RepID=UPI002605B93F|nr:acyltransferase domain-containing protein [Neomegalonema sp.]MDD2867992.1 acyltransferase domain-containing protein [Neomegalonema sp.]